MTEQPNLTGLVMEDGSAVPPSSNSYQKSFLKWAGGKFKVLPRIFSALPAGQRLIEPFAGSAVVSLNAPFALAIASDSNRDLVNLYQSVAADPRKFIEEASILFAPKYNAREQYDALRAEFNESDDPFRRSVIFVYLNRHCFNGLCRYNSKGHFNVPFGRYKNPIFPRKQVEQFAHAAQRIEFQNIDFEEAMSATKSGDVVYCDPPYVPLSLTANFTGYTEGTFGAKEQIRLAEIARELQARGIPVVISNHDTEFTRSIYEGATIESFGVQRNISRDGKNRGKAPELLAIFK